MWVKREDGDLPLLSDVLRKRPARQPGKGSHGAAATTAEHAREQSPARLPGAQQRPDPSSGAAGLGLFSDAETEGAEDDELVDEGPAELDQAGCSRFAPDAPPAGVGRAHGNASAGGTAIASADGTASASAGGTASASAGGTASAGEGAGGKENQAPQTSEATDTSGDKRTRAAEPDASGRPKRARPGNFDVAAARRGGLL